MTVKLTNSQFIARANTIHNFVYDYSQVAYKNNATKVQIICPHHGPFNQRPSDHLRGQGCPICKKQKASSKIRKPLAAFIEKATSVHGGTYDYSLAVYTNTHTATTIICPHHGPFNQRPSDHLRGQGCPICKKDKIAAANRLTHDDFILRCKVFT